MIETVLGLEKDGDEQPQFFKLTFRYANQGEAYDETTVFGSEANLRDVLKNGGIEEALIDALFANAN